MKHEFDFSNKTVVVTGASAGIGLQTALEFCRRGAYVIGVGRDTTRCEEARQHILRQVPAAKIVYLLADLSRQSEVRALAGSIKKTLADSKYSGLDVLVNNAGLFSDHLRMTEDGVETTIAVNHIAPFLLTMLLLPVLKERSDSRVITVSSGSHYKTFLTPERIRRPRIFISLWQYKVSKLANILFTLEFNRRQGGKFPHAFAVDPGLVNTEIGSKGTGPLSSLVWHFRQKKGVAAIKPAETILFLAGDPDVPKSQAVYWYDCAVREPSQAAKNEELAQRLWKESMRICGMDSDQES